MKLQDVCLDTNAIDALTASFAEGRLRLARLEYDNQASFEMAHLLHAARQWLMAPSCSLVKLRLTHDHEDSFDHDELQAVVGLKGAV